MNKFRFYFIVLITTVSLFSCSKNDSGPTYEPPRDHATQYKVDIADIEEYLKTNYITVVDHPGFVDDQNVTINKLDADHTVSIWDQTKYQLKYRTVNLHDIVYKLYYLVLREGKKDVVTGLGGLSPCNVDGVMTSYRGDYLSRDATTQVLSTTKFEEVIYPQTMLSLYSVITGWSETFPQFKTGTSKIKDDGTVSHYDFGAGVMFIPSGLAYYSSGSGSIPSYSPLIFSFKLYEIQRLDQDNDGVFSFQEDLDNDGYMYVYANTINYPTPPIDDIRYVDDTDRDGIPNFGDVDDDGDGYTTRVEITKPVGTNSGLSAYFPYDPIEDNPLTTAIETETKGIPSYDKIAKTFDYTTPGRLRIHIDKDYPIKP
jgi:hypothetical protein